ncbi:uncharacterized protein N0V89_008296 [Didymosphaeria variabile]|uniref:Uncharacterized protein n=1 Tax=Didymosphaeria variabile TaxID=1932322 RepID=A0A9W8XHB7_9PLEO|nr:uncharacterized protein N0V89_008296 [Didymosphaeria variabile]KAJ4349679.1 hypothetical protein N0V89_008296 [Didymosphaeria variabile]
MAEFFRSRNSEPTMDEGRFSQGTRLIMTLCVLFCIFMICPLISWKCNQLWTSPSSAKYQQLERRIERAEQEARKQRIQNAVLVNEQLRADIESLKGQAVVDMREIAELKKTRDGTPEQLHKLIETVHTNMKSEFKEVFQQHEKSSAYALSLLKSKNTAALQEQDKRADDKLAALKSEVQASAQAQIKQAIKGAVEKLKTELEVKLKMQDKRNQTALEAQASETAKLLVTVGDLEEHKNATQQKMKEQDDRLEAAKKEVHQRQDRAEEVAKVQGMKISSLKSKLTANDNEIKELKSGNDEQTANIFKLKTEIEALQKNTVTRNQFDDEKRRTSKNEGVVADLKKELNGSHEKQESEISKIKTGIESLLLVLKGTQTQLDQQEQKAADIENGMRTLNDDVAQLKTDRDEHGRRLAKVTEVQTTIVQVQSGLEKALQVAASDIGSKVNTLMKNTAAIKAVDDRVTNLESNLEEQSCKVSSTETSVKDLEKKVDNAGTSVSKLFEEQHTSISAVEQMVKTTEANFTEYTTATDQHLQQLDTELQEECEASFEELSALKQRLVDIQREYTAISKAIVAQEVVEVLSKLPANGAETSTRELDTLKTEILTEVQRHRDEDNTKRRLIDKDADDNIRKLQKDIADNEKTHRDQANATAHTISVHQDALNDRISGLEKSLRDTETKHYADLARVEASNAGMSAASSLHEATTEKALQQIQAISLKLAQNEARVMAVEHHATESFDSVQAKSKEIMDPCAKEIADSQEQIWDRLNLRLTDALQIFEKDQDDKIKSFLKQFQDGRLEGLILRQLGPAMAKVKAELSQAVRSLIRSQEMKSPNPLSTEDQVQRRSALFPNEKESE